MEKHYILYRTVNTLTGHYYIGVHGQVSDDSYLGSGIRLKRQISKYGREHFTRHTLAVFDTEAEAFEAEVEILELHLKQELCLNISKGGDGGANFKGKHHSDEFKARLRELYLKDKPSGLCGTCGDVFDLTRPTQEFCSKKCIPKDRLGKNLSTLQHRENMREKMKGNQNAKGHTKGPKMAAHNRWHVARGLISETCEHCSSLQDAEATASKFPQGGNTARV